MNMTTVVPETYSQPVPDRPNGGPIDLQACRILWLSVLRQAFDEALGLRAHGAPSNAQERAMLREKIKREAQSWIGTRDFYTVCRLAGVSPEAARRAFEAEKARLAAGGVRKKANCIEPRKGVPTMLAICKAVAAESGQTVEDLRGFSQHAPVAEARARVVVQARAHGHHLGKIGHFMGDRGARAIREILASQGVEA